MKRLLLPLVLFVATLVPSARAVDSPPYFSSLRNEVLNQLNIATNTTESDKKLVSALRKALTTIDKTKPDFASGAKGLGTLAKGLNRTAVSNEFADEFSSTIGDYVAGLLINASTLSNRLASTFPSKSRTAAEGNLADLDAALDSALAAGDVAAAAKFLSTAAKNLSTAAKNVDKAEDAPAPPSGFTATVTGAISRSFKAVGVVVSPVGPSNFNVIATEPLLKAPYGQRVISFDIINLVAGDNVISLGSGSSDTAGFIYQEGISGDSFQSQSGTIHVNLNPATKTLVGTIDFIGENNDAVPLSVHVTGQFSGNYQ